MKNTCSGCDNTWTGVNICHCGSGCHRTFSSIALFDAHRAGGEGCQDPASMRFVAGKQAGELRMRLNAHDVWVGNQPRPQFWETQGAAA
jgi:hypothetical protein